MQHLIQLLFGCKFISIKTWAFQGKKQIILFELTCVGLYGRILEINLVEIFKVFIGQK